MARFAELVFAYIDELSAASVAGHTDELSTSGRVRERYLDRLARNLLSGASADVLAASAERADWPEPRTLTAVLLPAAQVRGVLSLLGSGRCAWGTSCPASRTARSSRCCWSRTWRAATGGGCCGSWPASTRWWARPARGWPRGRRTCGPRGWWTSSPPRTRPPRWTPRTTCVDVVLGADPDALADLRTRVLEPLGELRPATAQRLGETLRSWLLHQGRRDDVAADLHVHAQTVRYRMGQLRDLYGDRLDDPQVVLELLLALHPPAGEDVVLPDDED